MPIPDHCLLQILSGTVDFANDSFKVILLKSGATITKKTVSTYSDVTSQELVPGGAGDYTVGGKALVLSSFTENGSTNKAEALWDLISWTLTTDTFTVGGWLIYQDTGNPATSTIMGYDLFSADEVVGPGGTFPIADLLFKTDDLVGPYVSNHFMFLAMSGSINLNTDQLKIGLLKNSAVYDPVADDTYTGFAGQELVPGGGGDYTVGGTNLVTDVFGEHATNNEVDISWNDVTFSFPNDVSSIGGIFVYHVTSDALVFVKLFSTTQLIGAGGELPLTDMQLAFTET